MALAASEQAGADAAYAAVRGVALDELPGLAALPRAAALRLGRWTSEENQAGPSIPTVEHEQKADSLAAFGAPALPPRCENNRGAPTLCNSARRLLIETQRGAGSPPNGPQYLHVFISGKRGTRPAGTSDDRYRRELLLLPFI